MSDFIEVKIKFPKELINDLAESFGWTPKSGVTKGFICKEGLRRFIRLRIKQLQFDKIQKQLGNQLTQQSETWQIDAEELPDE